MILVRLMGGLGNQMFQYAFGKMLAIKNSTDLQLDLSLLGKVNDGGKIIAREFDLDIFDIPFQFANQKEIESFNGYPDGSVLKRLWFKFSKLWSGKKLVLQENHHFLPNYLLLKDNTCVVGRWQSAIYFDAIESEIRKAFVVKNAFRLHSSYSERISNSASSIAIHVRRGDYVSNDFYKEHIGALDENYYKQAYDWMCSRISEPRFFIFSQDLEWCKSQLGFVKDAVFVSNESSKKGVAEDLHLLMSCKHHIISNSTFSWWGAYLSSNTEKIVVAPKIWANHKDFVPEFILPDEWIQL